MLGAGIVGTSIGLQQARPCRRARRPARPGEETLRQCRGDRRQHPFRPPFRPTCWPCCGALARAGSNLTLTFLPQVAPWLLAFRATDAAAADGDRAPCGRCLRVARAEHEALLAEAGAGRYLRKEGWLKLYRGDRAFMRSRASSRSPRNSALLPHARWTRMARARAQPGAGFPPCRALAGRRGITNPLAVTQAFAARFRRARRRCGARRCPLAAPGRWALAPTRRAARRRQGGGGARPVRARRLASASGCRSGSSAATTATTGRRATPRCRGR